jgi:CRP/FNR family cyclic AMP-dependent transcriptional regulator
MEPLESLLVTHPFTEGLSAEHLQTIMGCSKHVQFQPREMIFREGQEANAFYLVLSGTVALEIFYLEPGPITVQTVGPGEVMGWSWLVPPYRWKFDARAQERTEAIQVDAVRLRELLNQEQSLSAELLQRFALVMDQRLLATRRQLLDSYAVRH